MSTTSSTLEGGHFGRFEILLAERRLQVDGQAVTLGSRAFDLLAALVTRRDRVVPKDELIEVVWPGLVVEDNNLQVQISALRKVLGTQAIATVPGRGYQFTVAAAAPVQAAAATRAAALASTGAARPSRLLVADDNKVNRLLLCRSLELMGHHVASADNGRSALEKLRSEPIDLLLLDLEMPEIDGFGLLEQRAADAALREVPVIVTSSLEGAAHVARCIELGADDFLHKPVNPVLLQARVSSSLERKHLRDRQRELVARLAPDLLADSPRPGTPAAGRRVEATVLRARLRGIDALAAAQPAAETLELLGSWTTLMLDAIEGRGGRVTAIEGEAISAAFGAGDAAAGPQEAAWAAVQATREMAELAAQFNAERSAAGRLALGLGVGLASGEVVVGRAGTQRRPVLVCVGAAAQRAVRLEALAAERELSVLIDAATHAAVAGRAATSAVAPALLPGSVKAQAVYLLPTGS
jgi:adenylate cyclase